MALGTEGLVCLPLPDNSRQSSLSFLRCSALSWLGVFFFSPISHQSNVPRPYPLQYIPSPFPFSLRLFILPILSSSPHASSHYSHAPAAFWCTFLTPFFLLYFLSVPAFMWFPRLSVELVSQIASHDPHIQCASQHYIPRRKFFKQRRWELSCGSKCVRDNSLRAATVIGSVLFPTHLDTATTSVRGEVGRQAIEWGQ